MSQQLISALMNPAIYPHPTAHVELVETHISWVLLTGLRAYKIKKPVDLGFADFSTLERRRHFCEEEIRLNGRLAPNLYVDVVPITGCAASPQIDGDGPVIEWAVRMKQFNKAQMLDGASLQSINVQQIELLADECSAFHKSAAQVAVGSSCGTPSQIQKAVVETLNTLVNSSDGISQHIARLTELFEQQFERLSQIFQQRKETGKVRECHGDLHLGNLFLQGDRITVFDGIEFNESFRWIDVASDISFLIMDLTAHQCAPLANRFLNRWLEQTGDCEALKVLPFYCAYKATVRAKIDSIRLHQSNVKASDRHRLASAEQTYLDLARQLLKPRAVSLTITMGLSGSGKTTVTDRMIDECNAIRIRSDVERKRLHGLKLLDASDKSVKFRMYSHEATTDVYQRLKELATIVIAAGYPVVIDATFLEREQRRQFACLAKTLAVPFTIVSCEAREDVLRERIRRRLEQGNDPSEADDSVLDDQLLRKQELTSSELDNTIHFSEDTQELQFEALRRRCQYQSH